MLVVHDDRPALRTLLRKLADHHDVTSLSQPHEALARLASGERWDVILAFIMMGEMSGFELSQRLREARPELADRLVLMTTTARADAHVRSIRSKSRVRVVDAPDSIESFLRLLASEEGACA